MISNPGQKLVVLLLLALPLAGCVDSGEAPQSRSTTEDGLPIVDAEVGAIEGLVTDEEFSPVGDAQVGIEGMEEIYLTDAAGTFVASRLTPGEYRVVVQALGYQGFARRVEVVAGQIARPQFTLAILPTETPYYETYPFVGFEACQWYVGGTLSHCTLPYTQAHGAAKENGVNLSNYGLPPDVMDNRDKYNYTVRPDHIEVVSELFWEAQSAAALYQVLIVACGWYDPVWDECVPPGTTTTGVRYFTKVGTSPIQIKWTHPAPDTLPWVMSRANVNGNFSEQRPAGFVLEQRVEMYNSVFYVAEAPERFTAGPEDY